ncbi:hypothetical protein L9F63_021658, partial [Diploptera punctata]
MGAKASTANGGGTSPRARTFSTSSSSDVVAGGTGFSLLRAIPSTVSSDRQRARSLSSVPDSHSSHEAIGIPNSNGGAYDISESPETDSSSPEDHVLDSPLAANISLGRVYTAHSLPSHIWSLNGSHRNVMMSYIVGTEIQLCVLVTFNPKAEYSEHILTKNYAEALVVCQ